MRDIPSWGVFLSLFLLLFPFQVPGTDPQGKRFAVDFAKFDIQQEPFLPIDTKIITNCFRYSKHVFPVFNNITAKGIGNSSTICRFNFDPYQALIEYTHYAEELFRIASDEDAVWTCSLPDEKLCDGVSQCLTDECGCNNNLTEVFYCFDGSGCISFDGLCDGTRDCIDGSDECYCEDFVKISCPLISSTPICLPAVMCLDHMLTNLNCTIPDKSDADKCGASQKSDKVSPLYSCLERQYRHNHGSFTLSMRKDPISFVSSYCKHNCTNETDFVVENWVQFCDHVFSDLWSESDFVFICEKDPFRSVTESFHVTVLCDEQQDCQNGADEIGCPGRFYCSPNSTEWVDPDKVCDHVKDCADGSDECGTCDHGSLSSSKFLIRSIPILVVTIFMGFFIVITNFVEGYKCYRSQSNSKTGQIDRIFRLQIFFYDLLMGLYLCFIVIAATMLRFQGDYCLLERKWRASIFCSILGVLFSVSSHGSLLIVASVSVIRWLTCTSMVLEIKTSIVVLGSALGLLLNLAHAILPLLSISAVQDIFRTEIFFTHLDENPFFSKNPIDLHRIAKMYEGAFATESNTNAMLEKLRNTTSKGSMFDSEEIGYYGNTGLCIHNIFKLQESYQIYKLLYCITLTVLLATVLVTYTNILLEDRKSKARVADLREAQLAQGGRQGAGGVGDQKANITQSLTLKVALMIGSQLIAWIPFIIATVYYQVFSKQIAPPSVFEVFALVVIPGNSFLNPLFYSDLYKKAVGFLLIAGKRWSVNMIEMFTGPPEDMVRNIETAERAPKDEVRYMETVQCAPGDEVRNMVTVQCAPGDKVRNMETVQCAPGDKVRNIETAERAPKDDFRNMVTVQCAPGDEVRNIETAERAPKDDFRNMVTVQCAPGDKVRNIETVQCAPGDEVRNMETVQCAPKDEVRNIETVQCAPKDEVRNMETVECAPKDEVRNMETAERAPKDDFRNMVTVECAPKDEVRNMETVQCAPKDEVRNMETVQCAPGDEVRNMETVQCAPKDEVRNIETVQCEPDAYFKL